MRFLSFNLKNLSIFGMFLPKLLVTLKISSFYLPRCYQSKIKIWDFYSKSHVSINHVKSLGSASSMVLLPLIDVSIWVEYFLPERLSKSILVVLAIILFVMSEVYSLLPTKLLMKAFQGLLKKLTNFTLLWNISSWNISSLLSLIHFFNFKWKICIATTHC